VIHNMADASCTMNAGFASALGSKQVPEMFIEADQSHRPVLQDSGTLDDAYLNIPVLDLAFLAGAGDKLKRAEVVAAAAKACQTWGFFQIQNHGVDQALVERCEREAHRMFQLPLDAKERCHRPPGATFGYGANTWVNQKVMHWAESFHMQLHPTSNIREMALKLFPDGTSCHQFRYHPLIQFSPSPTHAYFFHPFSFILPLSKLIIQKCEQYFKIHVQS
jgi:hypothetical protein